MKFFQLFTYSAILLILNNCAQPDAQSRNLIELSRVPVPISEYRAKEFTAEDIMNWANLPQTLASGDNPITHGMADGKSVIAPKVMILNSDTLVEWLKTNNYGTHSLKDIVFGKTSITVEIEILDTEGRNPTRIILFSNGMEQGVG